MLSASERWGKPPPELVLATLERWGKPPPELELATYPPDHE